jgi:hypothetical protein
MCSKLRTVLNWRRWSLGKKVVEVFGNQNLGVPAIILKVETISSPRILQAPGWQ